MENTEDRARFLISAARKEWHDPKQTDAGPKHYELIYKIAINPIKEKKENPKQASKSG